MKTGTGIQKSLGRYTQRQQADLINLVLFFKNKENRSTAMFSFHMQTIRGATDCKDER
jgi:hypothetical protein